MKIKGKIHILIQLVCLTETVINAAYRYERLYRCQDIGEYMETALFCNGEIDCPNGEDEIYGCNKNITCNGRKSFVCDQQCKELSVRCNGINDCEDGTDEINCGDRTDVKNCTSESQFLCKDGLRCLELYETCDQNCNCFDCSDEDNINCDKRDTNLERECGESYFTTAKGPKCYCNSSNDDFNTWCDLIEPCDERSYPKSHSRRCKQIKFKIQLTCYEGFHRYQYIHETRYIQNCRKNDWWETEIIYATEDKINVLNVTSNTSVTIHENVYNITALSTANNYTYYALKLPNDTGCIFKSLIHSGKSEKIIDAGSTITAIAIDYITNHVYFTNGSLSVCKNDGSICVELDCCDITVVALAPKSGLMFYLKKEPKLNGFVLTRSTMVGDNKTTSMEKIYHGDFFSLLVDETAARLYLLETNLTTGPACLYQFIFNTTLTNETQIYLPVRTLGTYDDATFFTSWEKRFKNYIFTSMDLKFLLEYRPVYKWLTYYINNDKSSSISHLNVINGISNNRNENPCDKSSCSGLCLLRPGNSSMFHLNYTCLCNNFVPTATNQFCS